MRWRTEKRSRREVICIKDKQTKALCLVLGQNPGPSGMIWSDIAGRMLLALLLFLGAGGSALRLLELPVYPVVLAAVGSAVIAAALLFFHTPRMQLNGLSALVFGMLAFWLLNTRRANDGLAVVANRIIRLVSIGFSRIELPYEVSEQAAGYAGSVTLFLLPFAALLAVLCLVLAQRSGWISGAALLLLAAGGNLLEATPPAGMSAALLTFGVALLFCRTLSGSAGVPDQGKILLSLAAALLAVWMACGMISALLPSAAAQGLDRMLDRQQRAISAGVSALRYGRPLPGALPEGSFLAEDRIPSEKTALKVTMSEPQPVYLRGYVGQNCTAAGWSAPDRVAQYEYSSLFDQLQRGGFFPQTQLSTLAQLIEEDSPAPVSLTIENIAAGRGAVYTPYGLLSAGEELRLTDRLGEDALPSDGLFGARQYHITLLPGLEGRPAALYTALEQRALQPDKALRRYLEQESQYRSFVYEQYTGLSEEDSALLTDLLGPAGDTGKTHLAYDDARRNILAVLGEQLSYSQQTEPFDGEGSFLRFLLEQETPRGDALHYATAAVLMLRHYGIPARYVEGYVIAPGDLADMQPGQPFDITDERAHAWAEYYYDGVGWIVFEVTPPYLGRMGMTDDLPESTQPAPAPIKPDEPLPDKPKEDQPPEVPPAAAQRGWLWWLGLLPLAAALWLGYRYWLLAHRARDCASADSAAAIRAMMAVILYALSEIGLTAAHHSLYPLCPALSQMWGGRWGEELARVIEIFQKVLYSHHAAGREERDETAAFLNRLLRQIDRTSTRRERLLLRWIKCLY